MPDPRFFERRGPFTLRGLAEITGAALPPGTDGARAVCDIAPLETAGADELSFIDNPRYLPAFSASGAGACIAHPDRAAAAPPGMALLLTETPYLAYARAAAAFYPETPPDSGAVAADAAIDPTAVIGPGARIGPGVVVGARAEIGPGCVIGPNAVIGPGVVLGEDCRIGAAASVAFCVMGARVRVYAGARIGEAGFGFAAGPDGFVGVPQLGRVLVGDDVEIGANATLDRGSGPDTVIGAGTRIDNLVQIGHNVRTGRNCVIVAQVGIAGSTILEDNVMVGGQAGFAGHITIGAGAQIGAQSGIPRDVPPGARLMGTPAVPARQFFRQAAALARLANEKVKKDG